jgi:acyl carrier protein
LRAASSISACESALSAIRRIRLNSISRQPARTGRFATFFAHFSVESQKRRLYSLENNSSRPVPGFTIPSLRQGETELMDETRRRLVRCFETVFPDVPELQIPQASQASLSAWDSIAAITLVNVIEDEFGFQMDFDILPDLDTFERVLQYVETQVQG